VAQAVIKALESEKSLGKTYNISGAAAVTYNQLVETICQLLSRKVVKVHIPSGICVSALRLLERFTRRLPIKAEQIQRLNEDKSFDYSEAASDFNYRPISLAEGLHKELKEMGLIPSIR
jgi:nucleoside-diphosphate-sugar epimerase